MGLLSENKICEGPESYINILIYSVVIWLITVIIPQIVVFIYIIFSGMIFKSFSDDYFLGMKLNRFPLIFTIVVIILFTLYKSFVLNIDYQLFKTLKEKDNYNNVINKILVFLRTNFIKTILFTVLFVILLIISFKTSKISHSNFVLINIGILSSIFVGVILFLKENGYNDFTHIIMSSITTILLSFILFIISSHIKVPKMGLNINQVQKQMLTKNNETSFILIILITLTIVLYQLKSVIYKVLLNQKSYT